METGKCNIRFHFKLELGLYRRIILLLLFMWQVPTQGSASGPELKAARVTNWTIDTAQVDTYDKVYALLRLFPDRDNIDSAPQLLLGMCMCVLWLLLLLLQQHGNNSQKSNIE